ncbi:MAG: nickel-responsive transcriptional regulator NikR [Bryobacteraceae bacterium]
MSELNRVGVAIEERLLRAFDKHIQARGYTNRSEAFRDLIRDELIESAAEQQDTVIIGTLTLVYDHHVRLLNEKLTEIQHDHFQYIWSTLHVHMDHDHCLEVLILRGQASMVRRIADALISTKGVKHGRLTMTTLTGEQP